MNGNLDITKHLDIFIDLVSQQFEYGGKKYALNNTKESTDELFDRYGFTWLLGTIDKYFFRFSNLKRERDLLKIATYSFLLWIKRGFHIDNKRIAPIDTTLENKKDNFPKFINEVKKTIENFYNSVSLYEENYYLKPSKSDGELKKDDTIIYEQSLMLSELAKNKWIDIKEQEIIDLFFGVYLIWDRNFSNKPGQDMDINNEDKCKK